LKRILYLVLALVCVFAVTGCGEKVTEPPLIPIVDTPADSTVTTEHPVEYAVPTVDDVNEITVIESGFGRTAWASTGYFYTEREQIDAFLTALADTDPVLKENPNSSHSSLEPVNGGTDYCYIILYLEDDSSVVYRYFDNMYTVPLGDAHYYCELGEFDPVGKLIDQYSDTMPGYLCDIGTAPVDYAFTTPESVNRAVICALDASSGLTAETFYEYTDEEPIEELADLVTRSIPSMPQTARMHHISRGRFQYEVRLYTPDGEKFTYMIDDNLMAQDDGKFFRSGTADLEQQVTNILDTYDAAIIEGIKTLD